VFPVPSLLKIFNEIVGTTLASDAKDNFMALKKILHLKFPNKVIFHKKSPTFA